MNKDEMFSLIENYLKHNNFAYNLFVAYNSLFKANQYYLDVLNKASGFFLITRYALSKYMLLEFAKLYCGSGNERTIRKLINIVNANLDLFPKNTAQNICSVAEQKMNTELASTIERLKTRRDKDLAHNDSDFFDGEKNPALESYISCSDIEHLYAFSFELFYSLISLLDVDRKIELFYGSDDIVPFVEEFDKLLKANNDILV